MAQLPYIRGSQGALHKIVLEVRYRYGHTYLDRCGRTINAILRSSPEWQVQGGQSPAGSMLINWHRSYAFSFSSLKYDLSVERKYLNEGFDDSDLESFARQADGLHAIVTDELGIREFDRIGFRVWYNFVQESEERVWAWFRDLQLAQVSPSLVNAVEGSREKSFGGAVLFETDDRLFRLGFGMTQRLSELDICGAAAPFKVHDLPHGQDKALREALEQKRRGEQFAATIDVDHFIRDPELDGVGDFVRDSLSRSVNLLRAISRTG